MGSVENLSSSSEDESAETTLNDDLPRGSERDVIEYYFTEVLLIGILLSCWKSNIILS